MTKQVRCFYLTRMHTTDSCGFLPQANLFEFRSFIQIRSSNHHSIVELIGLMAHRQVQASSTLNFVGDRSGFGNNFSTTTIYTKAEYSKRS